MANVMIDSMINAVKSALKLDDRYTQLSIYLNEIKRDPDKNVFGSEEVLTALVQSILASKSEKEPVEMMTEAEGIYKTVVPLGEDTRDFELAKAVFLKLFEKDGIYFSGLFSRRIFLSFSDKQLYLETMCALAEIPAASKKLGLFESLAIQLRQFFTDEKSFSAALVSGAFKISIAEDPEAEIRKLVTAAERSAGVYDISEESIGRTEMLLRDTEEILENARHTLDMTDVRLENYISFTENSEKVLKNMTLEETEKLRREAKGAELELRRAYDSFLNEEHEGIIFEKDKLVREVIDSADSKIREMKLVASTIKDTTAAELFRINTEANKAIDRASAMLNNGELKNIISEVQKSGELVERIIRVDEFSRNFDTEKVQAEEAQEAASEGAAAAQEVTVVQSPVNAVATPVIRMNELRCREPADMTPNLFFDESYSFKDRFERLMQKKQKDIEDNGTLYHEHFDNIITAVIEDANPYLIGPSGCGKTFLVGQIAQLLGIEYLDIGYINEEYDILGFQTADGGYNYPAFYRAYKYGGIVFCDEFDNGNIRAAVKLNSFMSNGSGASYCFPNGERVMRHPNFRIIAAGNTSGGGADMNYNTREKIEESIQQRFTSIYVDYDNRLEQQILRDYPDWFEFSVQFRRATSAWSDENQLAAPGIFTTRDATSIKKYLDHQSYGAEDIMSYEFIETKDNEYLAFLEREMGKYYTTQRQSSKLFGIFHKQVTAIRNGEARR